MNFYLKGSVKMNLIRFRKFEMVDKTLWCVMGITSCFRRLDYLLSTSKSSSQKRNLIRKSFFILANCKFKECGNQIWIYIRVLYVEMMYFIGNRIMELKLLKCNVSRLLCRFFMPSKLCKTMHLDYWICIIITDSPRNASF